MLYPLIIDGLWIALLQGNSMSLQAGLDALKQRQYQEAIDLLEEFCRNSDSSSSEYVKAQMGLIKAYQRTGKIENAQVICRQLAESDNQQVREWAQQTQQTLVNLENEASSAMQKAGRAATVGVKLAMGGVGGSLALASSVTIALLFGFGVLDIFRVGLGPLLPSAIRGKPSIKGITQVLPTLKAP